ncbi:MAG: SdrD B-like domain-containing protein, partial [Methanothrix sp.]|nr:SdrD B-like domain-containing protein [Methanothrix sp.]
LMSGSTIVATTTTGPGGAYSFTNIAPGSYTVQEIVQSGWTQSFPAAPGTQSVTLVSGVAGPTDVDFGNWRTTGFSGVKFEDLNGNGIRDAGEPGLEGWTINLMSGNEVIANTTTGPDGAYSFTNITPGIITPGSYAVEEVVQPGWNQSYPAVPGTQTVTLVSGEAGPNNIDFGNWRPTGFSGTVFDDKNGDGIRDPGEPGLEGWTVNLMSGSTIVATTTTGPGGAYSFANIAPGSYTVQEIVQSGWTQSYPAAPGTQTVTLVSGIAGPTDIDFGNWKLTGFSGVKFEDLNGNGIRDAGEPGLVGWTINLMSGSTIIANTTTGPDGAYSFNNITPGSYTVAEAAKAGWKQTYPVAPGTQTVTLNSGESGPTDIDFGNVNLTSIRGTKFDDRNGNGLRDAGEPGLEGWTVNLKNGGIVFATTTTGLDGAYEFTGIAPGTFTVNEVGQPGWLQTYPASPGVHTVKLTSGVPGPNDLDFGNVHTAGFSGMKFQDNNGNGAMDPGEPGLVGWTVDLKNGGAIIATAITGQDGVYEFSEIIPGNYTIEEEQRLGWIQTAPPGNTYTADISSSGEIVVKRSDSGQTAVGPTEVDFGNQVISAEVSLSGVKFNDSDGDGSKEGNELLSGWTINLMQDGTVVNSTTTSSEAATLGSYKFTGILPGTYTLAEVPSYSSDWTQTYPTKNIYNIIVSENGQIMATTYDQTEVASNKLDFGNKYNPSGGNKSALEITKTTPDEIIRPDTQATFVITVKNNGNEEIHGIKIVDELSPMLEFVPYAFSGNTQIQHTFEGGNIVFDLEPLGSLQPGDSWTISYKVKLSSYACTAEFSPASFAPIVASNETKLKVMAVENGLSNPSEIVQRIDALSRNKTKLEAKLKSIKGHRDAFDKANSTLESGIKSIAAMNFTSKNYTNISGGERLNELLNATGSLIHSEYSRPNKYDLLVTEYGLNGEVISDFYTFLPTKETLKIEYNKPYRGYKTYTVRYYATGDTLIMIFDFYGNMISVEYRKTPGLAAPEYLTNCATAYGKTGEIDETVVSNRACTDLRWSCKSSGPEADFLLTKTADREVAQVGETVKYAFMVQNTGTAVLNYFTLNDDKMGIIVLNDLDPLNPGESRTYYGNYTVKEGDGPKLMNVVIATALDPDENVITRKATEYVRILEGCGLKKTASPKVVRPGDYVTYNITWDFAENGDEIVDDYPQGVTFISATPSPIDDGKNNKWIITKSSGTIIIIVQVAQDIGNTSFEMDQGVRGTGFVNVRNDIHTNPVILKNKATMYQKIDGNYVEDCTAYADVSIGPPQTYVALKEHGSGDYASEEVIRYQNSNSSISVTKGLTATHKPTSFSLPNNRDVDFQSKWSEMAQSKNYATGGSTNEQYTHASRISRNSSLHLDENGSSMKTEADFEGVGHIGLNKNAVEEDKTWNATDVFQSQEDYVGSFKINQKFDEYGRNAEYEKSVNGTGYVSAKKDLGKAQSSYESGTGSYQSDEKISTVANYISKDINLTHLPTSYNYTPTFSTSSDLKWSEGMWSKTPNSLISERFSSASNLSLHRAALGLNEMATEASVTGQADFRTAYRDEKGNGTIDRQETYIGDYDIKRKTILGGVAKYDRPHISLSKMAKVDLINSTIADYRIIIENNGNSALAPVYIKDVFPAGTEYITSSLRPAELKASYANWSLPAMGIGSKVIIDLQLNITQEPSNLVNRVEAAGKYDEMWTLARNFSVSNLNWLTCCPPQISASKTARIDSLDPKVVWYTLNLKNREKYTMVAFWMDRLPLSMTLLNSSLEPSENRSGLITWTILDLAPGENRSIIYSARAESDGTYINTAHIEAFSVDGPDGAAADVEARINLGEGRAVVTSSSSDWQPPTCFGLNCSGQIYSDDWVPCYTCGMGENGGVAMPPCASCIDTGDDSLP